MDLQCSAVILCLDPDDAVPANAGDRRIATGYFLTPASAPDGMEIPVRPAPVGSLWQSLVSLADEHRGEAIVLFAPADVLDELDARGVTFEVDSNGPLRI